jgi:hypothetical protein
MACSSPAPEPDEARLPSLPEEQSDAGVGGGWTNPPPQRAPDSCLEHETYQACSDCCFEHHPKAKALVWDTLRECVCRKPSASCTEVCGASYCAGSLTYDEAKANKPCLRCLERAYEGPDLDCLELIGAVCLEDEDCIQAYQCDDRCFDEAPSRDGGAGHAAGD